MDTLQWRGRAKVVAYVDLIITSMALPVVILLVIFAGVFTTVANDLEVMKEQGSEFEKIDSAEKKVLERGAVVICAFVACVATLAGTQLWAAITLMSATDVGRQIPDALQKASIWRYVTVGLLLIQVPLALLNERYLCAILETVVRGIFLVIVSKFMSEANAHLEMTSMPGPTGVTVKK